MSIYNCDVKNYYDRPVDGGVGRRIYQQDSDGKGAEFILLKFADTLNDVPEGTPVFYDENYSASMAVGTITTPQRAITVCRIPCSKLASGDYYYAYCAINASITGVKVSSATEAATTFDDKPLVVGVDGRAGLTAAFTETVAVESDDGVTTPSAATLLTKLRVGDYVLIGTHYATIVELGAATFTIYPKPATDIAAGAAISRVAIPLNNDCYGLGNAYLGDESVLTGRLLSYTAGTDTLEGTGTAFLSEVQVGDFIGIPIGKDTWEYEHVLTVTDDDTIVLSADPTGTAVVGGVLKIKSHLVKAYIK